MSEHPNAALLRRAASKARINDRHDMSTVWHTCGAPSCLAGEIAAAGGRPRGSFPEPLGAINFAAGALGVELEDDLGPLSPNYWEWPPGYDLDDRHEAARLLEDVAAGKFPEWSVRARLTREGS